MLRVSRPVVSEDFASRVECGRPSADQLKAELDRRGLQIKLELDLARGQLEGGRQDRVFGERRSEQGGAGKPAST
jgi:hypothetical protein